MSCPYGQQYCSRCGQMVYSRCPAGDAARSGLGAVLFPLVLLGLLAAIVLALTGTGVHWR